MRQSYGFVVLLLWFSTLLYSEESSLFLDLETSIEIGLENSYELRFNRIEQYSARKYLAESYRLFLPVLSVDYAHSDRIAKYAPDSRMQSVKMKLDQPLFRGGRYWVAVEAAKSDIVLKRMEGDLGKKNLTGIIRKKYFEVLVLGDIVRIQELLEKDAHVQVDVAHVEKDVGVMTVIDMAEIEAYAANASLDYIKAKHQRMSAENEFKKILNIDLHQTLVIDAGIMDKYECHESRMTEEDALRIALQSRVELITKRIALQKSTREFEIARLYYLPEVNLSFGYDFQKDGKYPFERSWNAALGCSFQIGGVNTSSSANMGKELTDGTGSDLVNASVSPFSDISIFRALVESEAKLKSAQVEFEKIQRDLALEVSTALQKMNEGWEMMKILKDREEILRQRYDVYQLKLKVGEAKRVDSLKAEVEYTKARTETVKGILEYINVSMDFETVLGLETGSLGLVKRKVGK